MPDSWEPLGIAVSELVACLEDEQEVRIELCLYNGPNIERFQYQRTIRLRSAKTGWIVATGTIKGDPPRYCRQSEAWSLVRLEGDHTTVNDAIDWLEPYAGDR